LADKETWLTPALDPPSRWSRIFWAVREPEPTDHILTDDYYYYRHPPYK